MRTLVALLLMVLFSGCVAEEDEPTNPLFEVCPQWVAGPTVAGNVTVDGSAALALAPRDDNGSLVLTQGRFPLDLYVLTIDSTGPVTIRAYTTNGTALLVRDAGADTPDSRPSLNVDGTATLSVYLTAVAHDTTPASSGLELRFEGNGEVTVAGTAWYRVCGAVLP